MIRNQKYWINEYEKKGALWIHDGNPKRPHALLTSGKHSNGFFNSELVMEDPLLLDEACAQLVERLWKSGLNIDEGVDRVVGPAMGAITLAHDIARHIGRTRNKVCLRAYTEKETDGISKLMVFKKTSIRPTESILMVEDVLTTGGSVNLTETAVASSYAYVVPFVAVLVNRSGLTEVNGKKIIALIDHPMPMSAPEECWLCKQDSEAIRPKGAENWARLCALM